MSRNHSLQRHPGYKFLKSEPSFDRRRGVTLVSAKVKVPKATGKDGKTRHHVVDEWDVSVRSREDDEDARAGRIAALRNLLDRIAIRNGISEKMLATGEERGLRETRLTRAYDRAEERAKELAPVVQV